MKSTIAEWGDLMCMGEIARTVERAYISYQDTVQKMFTDVGLPFSADSLPFRASGFAPAVTAEAFALENAVLIERATYAHLCIDGFAQLIDDATDKKSGNPALNHVASLLMVRATTTFGGLVPKGDAFWKFFEQCFESASEAELLLLDRNRAEIAFSARDLTPLAKKSSLILVAPALYASLTGDWNRAAKLEPAILSVATAIQLVDDLVDWHEDAMDSRLTYASFLQRLRHGECRALQSDTADIILNEACAHLETALRAFPELGCLKFSSLVEIVRVDLSKARASLVDLNRDECASARIRRTLDPKLGH